MTWASVEFYRVAAVDACQVAGNVIVVWLNFFGVIEC